MINNIHGKNFVPVAEEYIRTGHIDKAIELLKEGIELYPGYLSARVSLGKAYIEKGLSEEAMQEFEHVVSASPDNLLAQRKLAFLYKESGSIDSAIKSCEAVLIINPKDHEISELRRKLEAEKVEVNIEQTVTDNQKALKEEIVVSPSIDFTAGWEVSAEESQPDGLHDEFLTESMGDICIAQGEKEKGIEIYRKILQKDPDNESVRGKLTGLSEISDVKKDTQAIKREQQTARLNDFLNKVRTNRR